MLDSLTPLWKAGQYLELEIDDLSATGTGVAHWGEHRQIVFVPDSVPGDRVRVRLTHVKPNYAHGILNQLLESSPHRIRPACIVADKCGGCQWQTVDYAYQLQAKRNQVIQALQRIGKIPNPPVESVLAAPDPLGYRNKVTYPLKRGQAGQVLAGYYRKGSHRLVNLNQCPVQDPRLNPLLAEIKQDIQQQSWPIYDEQRHQGGLRHLGFRIGRQTGEILVTLVAFSSDLPGLAEQAQDWLQRYPNVVGVCVNVNCDRTNRIFGEQTQCLAGRSYLYEQFMGLTWQIEATPFFQIYTEQAEALLQNILTHLQLQGHERVVDLYCGIGTLTLPIAQRVKSVLGIEIQGAAVAQAQANAALNHIANVTFTTSAVEDCFSTIQQADLFILDPPRKGCALGLLQHLGQLQPPRIVYMSCNPATLARDLHILCQQGYHLHRVQPADFFPQTAHVECVAFLHASSHA
ncbi:23S rRNA (uracil(1939)-C(5))-methyltransferase RlmD [Synechococcales cyanobacterium C]|uniref:23S rRNA (Uracil(1939)-C(5))-methyltransferase RlmD n=1 Tax=Petrachloros mirabilis ULC683 TaxID=2781853 RepID=A0A8K2A6B9_9CYAN|nr:23S rRNA (uracil(1939)-C(5))-methyltransferase RlmD [Petrachloros mirabilis]NCJ05229.1 23S rRNA (uracil(1939)-C(5))-methyltransferase RlmD [Petrachloros mirabilis ULC683]